MAHNIEIRGDAHNGTTVKAPDHIKTAAAGGRDLQFWNFGTVDIELSFDDPKDRHAFDDPAAARGIHTIQGRPGGVGAFQSKVFRLRNNLGIKAGESFGLHFHTQRAAVGGAAPHKSDGEIHIEC